MDIFDFGFNLIGKIFLKCLQKSADAQKRWNHSLVSHLSNCVPCRSLSSALRLYGDATGI